MLKQADRKQRQWPGAAYRRKGNHKSKFSVEADPDKIKNGVLIDA